mmetsp:Transcript_19940/g.67515  ORF Transcript_19940/g.67515 Transcript_19940/m.67515 type:complete len:474 (-) Transcript_19940:246-1667(-)
MATLVDKTKSNLGPAIEREYYNTRGASAALPISGTGGFRDRAWSVQSDDGYSGKFEGPEKTLEVCFSPDVGHENGCRALSRRALDSILDEARCTILSKASNSYLDAYVLSESSLFVYPWKVVIKTCGRTTLLRCLRRLLEHTTCDAAGAEPALGLRLEWVGYSRKNYAFPDEQPSPHTSFGEELAYLKAHCDDTFGASNVGAFDGQGYVLGPITGDHWFVYVADECERPASSSTERTINIMMFDLADDVRDAFYVCDDEKDDLAQAARNMTQRSGLARLVVASTSEHNLVACASMSGLNMADSPGAAPANGAPRQRETFVDAAAFEPCGYSMNALCFESYTTVHVTPEKTCSYASFETNTALKSYASLVKNVIAVFKPKRVVLTLFADEAGLAQLPRNATFDGLPVLDVRSVGTYARSDFSSLLVEQDCVCMMANYVFVDPNDAKRQARGVTKKLPLKKDAAKKASAYVGSLQ